MALTLFGYWVVFVCLCVPLVACLLGKVLVPVCCMRVAAAFAKRFACVFWRCSNQPLARVIRRDTSAPLLVGLPTGFA